MPNQRMPLQDIPRFDMRIPPQRQHLLPLIRLLSMFPLLSHKNKLKRTNMEGIRPPYLLLCNHNAFMDFMVAEKAVFPHRANFVVAIDGYLNRVWLMRFIGCICKRKFTNDISLVRNLKRVIENGDIAAIYPEARYSLCGTNAVLPSSIGQLCKYLKVPVVTLICHGHHVNSPFFNTEDHKVKGTEAELKCIANADDVERLTADELKEMIEKEFVYDDYRWQEEKGIRITYPRRAKGLHKILYQCPHCDREYRMTSQDNVLSCTACGKQWEVDEYSRLRALDGETEFTHIPDWYEWERSQVRREVKSGTYGIELRAQVDSLPDGKRYRDIGNAVFRHDMDGFHLTGEYEGEAYELHISVPEAYSVHIEYDYLGKKGDCIDLNTLNDTLYTFPEGSDFSVTKISLATEELYDLYRREHPIRRVRQAKTT